MFRSGKHKKNGAAAHATRNGPRMRRQRAKVGPCEEKNKDWHGGRGDDGDDGNSKSRKIKRQFDGNMLSILYP